MKAVEDIDNDGRKQEEANLLDKMLVSSRQTAIEEHDCPLDLGPYMTCGLVGNTSEWEKESDESKI